MDQHRQIALGGLLLALLVLTGVVLRAVLQTVVFAVTVAYVLYPVRQWFARRTTDRIASAIATLTTFFAVVLVFSPLAFLLYERRDEAISVIQQLPDTISVTVGEPVYDVETAPAVDAATDWISDFALNTAVAAPEIALQLTLFTLLLYGILYKPHKAQSAILAAVPAKYHDILRRLHERTRMTLFAIYVLQALTAIATFIIAVIVFWGLGYEAVLTLAAIAGILQFIPIVGPSLLVFVIAANDFLVGFPVRGIAVLAAGLLLISFMPDAIIRTQLAGYTGKLPATLYFVGFVGGILTIGAIGIILGPLVVALLVEVVQLLSERTESEQQSLSATAEKESSQ
ncbi:MAG: AI-2E family transporter [Halovenus sp.]